MFFDPTTINKNTHKTELLLQRQCSMCPLKHLKKPEQTVKAADILVITRKQNSLSRIDSEATGYSTNHVHLVECGSLDSEPDTVSTLCCVGRKLDTINKTKPKVVIALGYDTFKELEVQFKHSLVGILDYQLMPTRYKGHDFWLLTAPDFNVPESIQHLNQQIRFAMTHEPEIIPCNYDNIEFAMTPAEIDAAFKDLEKLPTVAQDVETTGLRPYAPDAKILTIAIGTYDRTIVFPVDHPQAPYKVATQVMNHVLELKKPSRIHHNGGFELEWIVWLTKFYKYLHSGPFDDTMAQAYILNERIPKSLDACLRRAFGIDLKAMSNVNIENLINEPLENVMMYNGGDTKYTHKLFHYQERFILADELQNIYRIQMDRIPACALAQMKGCHTDQDFIQSEIDKWEAQISEATTRFQALPEVREMVKKHGLCNPRSKTDVATLYYDFLQVPKTQTSFDEAFLTSLDNPVAKAHLDIRKPEKMLSTYLLPYSNKPLEGAGNALAGDGLIHTNFNTMFVVTGRLSSSNPNMQNLPSRGGKKYLRNVVRAALGYKMYALDYGQIEYRVIASFTQDPEMLKAIWEDLDVHMYWAERLVALFPDFFVKENNPIPCAKDTDKDAKCGVCKKCCMKEFRSSVKNQWTFPLCFGSSNRSIGKNLKILEHMQFKLDGLIKEFWERHAAVRRWQEDLAKQYNRNGWVANAFGRRYHRALSHNEIINYPVQGTAVELNLIKMAELAKMAVECDFLDLAATLQIHDDLSFFIREDQELEVLPMILEVILDYKPYTDWLKVSLIAEVQSGYSWGSMSKLGDFSSEAFGHTRAA